MSKQKNDVSVVEVKVNGKQAINELGALELRAGDLRREMDGAKRGTKEFIAASRGLEETKVKTEALRKSLGLIGMTLGQLIRYQKDLRSAMTNTATYGTAEYKKLDAQLQQVNRTVDHQTKKLKGTAGFFGDIRTEMKSMAVTVAAMAAGAMVYNFFDTMISGSKELSDAISDVEKTTDLTTKQVKELNKEFKTLDTRTPRTRLLELARDAGKMNIKTKKDIFEFVESANMIEVALKEDLGEGAIKQIAKLNDLLGVSDAYGYAEAMQRTGSVLNELGASSTAQEQFLVNMGKRLGGIAANAKIAITDIMGLAAATDSLGQTAETSSTATGMLIVDMFKDTSVYANIAKMSIQEFTHLLDTDTNEALLKVLEGLGDSEAGFGILVGKLKEAGVDGARANQVLSTLAANTGTIREQQNLANKAFREATSIQEEYNIKNQNHASNLARISKWWNALFMSPILLGGLEKMTKAFADLVSSVDEAGNKFNTQKKRVADLNSVLPDLEANYFRLTGKTNRTQEEQFELNETIKKIAEIVPTAISKFDDYGNVLDVSIGKLRKFSVAQKEAMKLLNKEAIEEQEEGLLEDEAKRLAILKKLNTRDSLGDMVKQVQSSGPGFNPIYQEFKLRPEEIQGLREDLTELEAQITGRRELLREYQGIAPMEAAPASVGRAGMLSKGAVPIFKGDTSEEDETKKGSKAANDKALKEAEQALEKFKKIQQDISKIQEDLRIKSLDKETQEIERAKVVYAELETELKTHLDNKTITQAQYNTEVARIEAAKTTELDTIKASYLLEREKEVEKNKEEIALALLDDQAQAILKTEEYYDRLIEIARTYGIDTKELEEARRRELELITNKYDKKDLKEAKELAAAKMALARNMSEVIGFAIDIVGKKGEDLNTFQKMLAGSQIAIDTATSLAAIIPLAVKSASKDGPLAAFTFAGYIAAMAGTVLGAIAKAKSMLSSANDVKYDSSGSGDSGTKKAPNPRRKSFFLGGHTGDQSIGMSDQYGEITGAVHAREYVIPEMTMSHPFVASLIPAIENIRKNQIAGNKSIESAPGKESMESTILLKQILISLKAWPTSIRAHLLLSDLEKEQDMKSYLEKRYAA